MTTTKQEAETREQETARLAAELSQDLEWWDVIPFDGQCGPKYLEWLRTEVAKQRAEIENLISLQRRKPR